MESVATTSIEDGQTPSTESKRGGSHDCETPSQLQYAFLFVALALSSLGLGGTRFTNATMGADQFDKPNNQGSFFSWYCFALYLASAMSCTTIIYIQDSVSWGLGFGICVISNVIGLAKPFVFVGKMVLWAHQAERKSFRDHCSSIKIEGDRLLDGSNARSWWLCTVEEVKDLKTLIKTMPLWSTGVISDRGVELRVLSNYRNFKRQVDEASGLVHDS
ncbi:unnamed protein product [Dovyalis caffra]|uniref:Uncharacterized protein n=1 Tax=Dovyalis caffra TaxID=77055 RepID=A0AAV1QVR0_9ROSI|nr:unnamed protein product [Dovyalis caffra]